MLDVVKDYIAEALNHSISDEFVEKVNSAKSKRQLVDICLDINAMPYFAKSVAEGWGMSPDYIETHFGAFLDGAYVYDDGYTSAAYVNQDIATIDTTAALIINCDRVDISANHVCELYIVGDCKIESKGAYIAYFHHENGDVKKVKYGI